MRIRSKQDFWSGLMFVGIGLFFALEATHYQMGTAARMGPGYFPFWLGVILAVMGAGVALGALSIKAQETRVEKFDWRVTALIIGSVMLFGVLLNFLGVYLSTFILVVVSSIAGHDFNWKVAVANGAFLVFFSYLAFIRGLGLIFPLWPSFS
ncbi:tripartite tricarboxylate transporter TctB family protein [Parapusillimonas granuli]|uniref:Tripartite tricarboxylate transporter TctB family protein n=1 Tax=Parapusillimonas granuli TaxID=380911 RepID=A0A853G0V5_9BURK|nr:tripartite tricarboxylate transporter TctB family protein [Parapusillimonas granuli]MBB5215413.1 hypothetical protein [Parapusillimonas granuli]MEB2400251.1 tripartite tricarboxylate transporter TctB family protein [Alcaligenaceae bacterium]NYT49919.1 tripartite tricarboxylate transporter TctB family protein [Parapusillimonas granuli]